MWLEITGNENLTELCQRVSLISMTEKMLTHYEVFSTICHVEPENFVDSMLKNLLLTEEAKDFMMSLFNASLLEKARNRNP